RAVRDHLVGIGVGRGTRARLKDVQHELVVEHAWWTSDFLGGLRDGVGLVSVQDAEIAIGYCRGVLDRAQRPDKTPIEALAADREILERSSCRRAVIGALRHFQTAHRIVFDTAWRNRTRAPAGRHAHSVDEVLRAPDASVRR